MSIVANTDFTGEYSISQSCFDSLDEYITLYEKFYLVRLLGADLYSLFIADLTATTPQVPQTAIYLDLFNPFEIDEGSCLFISEGIRVMLKQFIYFHYVRDLSYKKDITGVVINNPENGVSTPYNGYNLVESYNRGIDNYHTLRWYICDNSTDYPDENGVLINATSGI